MTTHVFIVDSTTFQYHLEYLFAGTGSKDNVIDFNNNTSTQLNHTTENNLVSMIADSQRIRKDDLIVFYLQQDAKYEIYEGKFYGIFKAKEDGSFLDQNDNQQFLKSKLKKSLTFRTLIEPLEVYAEGVTEWEALDEIKNISSPNQMLWSLIYRKLKGNRGNTMITIYESERLIHLIRTKNKNVPLKNDKGFSFDMKTQKITTISEKQQYKGRKETINIYPRLVEKYRSNKAFEPHLQTYIIQCIGRGTNNSLDESVLLKDYSIEWIGNEVSCGVGMQRIDIMLSLIKKNFISDKRIILPIELKAVEASSDVTIQIQRYIDWLEQYYIPNRISDIQPCIISKKIEKKNDSKFKDLIQIFEKFNRKNTKYLPLKYIEYELNKNNHLIFQKIDY
ncbi:MAG: DUF91 domain-containing protein [Bacteroidia bacterium]|nr:DUF91 domain-containing protein [Bacteroidia bacterium]